MFFHYSFAGGFPCAANGFGNSPGIGGYRNFGGHDNALSRIVLYRDSVSGGIRGEFF